MSRDVVCLQGCLLIITKTNGKLSKSFKPIAVSSEEHLEPCETSKMENFAEECRLLAANYFNQNLRLRCLTKFWIKHCLLYPNLRSLDPPPPPFFKGGKANSDYRPRKGGNLRILKRGWKYGAGAGLLKRGDRRFSYLIFSRFIIFTYGNYFTLCKIVLCIWRKIIFFCHHNFMRKGHSKLSKNEPEDVS